MVAEASYEVTQEDFDYGQVYNHATVEGTPTVVDENDPEYPDKVTDEDDACVPGKLDPKISLTKEADRDKFTESGETITYTFTVKNTGDTTLTNIELKDPMFGDQAIGLGKYTLVPGEETTGTATYQTSQDDLDYGIVLNEATVEGTPPPAYTDNPDNPDRVTDTDNEDVPGDSTPKIELVKEADKQELAVGETIEYIFTATNTGNVTLEKVNLTDILEGISEIEYLTINGVELAGQVRIILP